MSDFSDFLGALQGGEWEERPVSVEEFLSSENYLNQPALSPIQTAMVRAGTQILREDTLIELYGEKEGIKRYGETFNECTFMLGKGCHAPYTPIYNAETGAWQRLDSITEDSTVIGYTDGALASEYSTEAFVEGHGSMLRIKTSLGLSEDIYEGHKYYVWKRPDFFKRNERKVRGPQWVEAKDILPGDKVGVGMGFDVSEPDNIPVEIAHFLGYVIGDGCAPADHNRTLNVDFGRAEKESMERYEKALAFIGSDFKKTSHPKKNMDFYRHGVNDRALEVVKEHGLWGSRAHNKFIPAAVWKSDNSTLREFISALWSSDGTVYIKKTSTSVVPTAEYCTVSEQLAHDVQRALMRLGVPAGLRSRIPTYTYKGEKREGQRAYYITVNGSVNFERFATAIPMVDYKAERVQEGLGLIANSKYRQNMFARGLYWDRVKSVESIGEGEYWTLTQPNSHNYIGDGLVSHQSGKDFVSTLICCYLVYILLCLKNPQKYFGKPDGDNIDIMNIAVNAQQANRVFFKSLLEKIRRSPWFEGKYIDRQGEISFDKSINIISGHSESESLEGYNVLCVVLDEISGFALESSSGNAKAKTAANIYDMHRASVDSRFPNEGKVILLSFPRFDGDFISQRYDDVVAEKEVIQKSHTFLINPDLPKGTEGNEFTIEWDEDHITRYKYPKMFALKRPTWDVNPTKKVDDFMRAFLSNESDAMGRFACMPSSTDDDTFFKRQETIDTAFSGENGLDENNVFREDFLPDPLHEYYIHVDLAKVHDRCAVVMSHVDKWITHEVEYFGYETQPVVKVDVVRWWATSKEKPMDFNDVTDFILALRRRGFDIKLVTFDRWGSIDTMNFLKQQGIKTDLLSVANKHYDDFMGVMYDGRLKGPEIPELIEELKALRWIKGKVDHQRSGYNDISDATCGSIANAVTHTTRKHSQEVEVVSLTELMAADRLQREQQLEANGVIQAPKKPVPNDIQDWLNDIQLL